MNGTTASTPAKHVLTLASSLLATLLLSGCLVAGYSSSGGAFLWPGGLGLFVVILLVVLLLRRRR